MLKQRSVRINLLLVVSLIFAIIIFFMMDAVIEKDVSANTVPSKGCIAVSSHNFHSTNYCDSGNMGFTNNPTLTFHKTFSHTSLTVLYVLTTVGWVPDELLLAVSDGLDGAGGGGHVHGPSQGVWLPHQQIHAQVQPPSMG